MTACQMEFYSNTPLIMFPRNTHEHEKQSNQRRPEMYEFIDM